ncbi:MAG TPA: S53 family peptidase [Planktothrix sp.]|jgi:kumamolisin
MAPQSGKLDAVDSLTTQPAAHVDTSHLLDLKAIPDSTSRTGTWLKDGAKNFFPGFGHSLAEDFGSWQGLEKTGITVVGSMAITAALKAALPEGGITGKVVGTALLGVFGTMAAKPVYQSYEHAQNAVTMGELHASGKELGYIGGEFTTSMALGTIGAFAGGAIANGVLESEALDDFAASKARFWEPKEKWMVNKAPKLSEYLLTPEAIQRARTVDMNTRTWQPIGTKAMLMDSMKKQAPGEKVGEIDPNERFNVSIYAKSVDDTGLKLDRRLKRIARQQAGFVSDQEMAEKFGANKDSMSAIQTWAESKGLKVTLQDARNGRMVVNGTGAQFEDALGTKFEQWKSPDGVVHRSRVGALSVDSHVSSHIDAILGSDNRPAMTTQRTPFVPTSDFDALANEEPAGVAEAHGAGHAKAQLRAKPILASDLARARGLKVDANTGKGKTIGIGELGGDVDLDSDATFYTKRGLPVPERMKVGVNGTVPKSDGPNGADGEVALDTNVAGLTAPGAKQRIAFGENSDAGFPDTQNELAFPTDGGPAADVITWSWGQYQGAWTKQAQAALTNALKRSAAKGITTFVAAGDNGAADGAPKGFDVDFPSASPYVTSVGGTQVILDGKGGIAQEVSWNDGARGGQTGGGVSNQTKRPDFQAGMKMPANANGNGFDGRVVPDVSENASPKSGYIVQVDGQEGAIGGTSGAAPQWAAYTAAMASELGKNFGNINYFLYQSGNAGVPIFRDITSGDNNGYKSGPGFDAVTGWGTPVLDKMIDALKVYKPVSPSRAKVVSLYNAANDNLFNQNRTGTGG